MIIIFHFNSGNLPYSTDCLPKPEGGVVILNANIIFWWGEGYQKQICCWQMKITFATF